MKKFILFACMAALTAVSCSKTAIEGKSTSPASYEFSISANINADEDTKTAYAGDKTFSWSDGDQISVLFNDGAGNNKFYTLTTSEGGGKSATFSGSIDAGWTVGSSDSKYYALYPAGAHSYTEGSLPTFNIPAETDFTESHFSANLPMFAASDDGTLFSFNHITAGIKFTFTDLDVTKVTLTIQNLAGYNLSGDNPIAQSGSEYYMKYNAWGSSERIISFTENVVSKTATFYLPYRSWDTGFKPVLTLKDANTGFTIKTITASKAFGAEGMASSQGKISIVPGISAPGTGSPFVSKFGIDWSKVTVEGTGATSAGHDGIVSMKAAADAGFLYVYFAVDDSKLLKGQDYSNYTKLILGEESVSGSTSWMWGTPPNTFTDDNQAIGWLLRNDAAKFSSSGELIYNDSQATSINGINYYEVKLNRSAKTYLSSGAGKAHVGMLVYYQYYAWGGTQGDYYMYAPGGGSMLEVTLPDYVAP